MSEGAKRIGRERARQVAEENYDHQHDDEHIEDELAWAAVCYAAPERVYVEGSYAGGFSFTEPWPAGWDDRRRKNATGSERIRELVKAGALIAAEIDRLIRARRRAAKAQP